MFHLTVLVVFWGGLHMRPLKNVEMYTIQYSSILKKYKTKITPGSVTFYDIWPGNKVGLFCGFHTGLCSTHRRDLYSTKCKKDSRQSLV